MKVILEKEDKQILKYLVAFVLGFIAATLLIPGSLNLFSSERGGPRATASDIPEECKGKSPEDVPFCIINLAKEKNNSELCEKISDTETRNFCYGYVKGDKERCEKVKDKFLRKRCLEEAEK